MTSKGDHVDEEGEADAVEDVVEEDLCGWVMVLFLVFTKYYLVITMHASCHIRKKPKNTKIIPAALHCEF